MMAHIHKAYDHHHWLFMLIFLVLSYVASSSDPTEAATLLKFKSSLLNATALDNWTNATSPCNGTDNWAGLYCDHDDNVFGLNLSKMGLRGIINIDALLDLSGLKTLSVMNNSFDGPIPSVNKLSSLVSFYLSYNNFSGEIPEDFFVGMNSLKKIYLDGNEFTGKIPKSLAALTKIVELDIRGNQFSGKLPKFSQNPKAWKTMNVSYNRLEGRIPASLRNSDPSAFLGNLDLCGKPLAACKSSKKKLLLIIAVTVISVAVILFIAACLERRRSAQSKQVTRVQDKLGAHHDTGAMEVQLAAEEENNNFHNNAERGGGGGELYFVQQDRNFELEELLRAPAEVLGSGSFGSSYKAGILSGSVVVKKFRQMNQVKKDEFYDHMRRLGRLSHPNLLPLIAFYYRKEEKLLVHAFVANGSLASHLHVKREPGQPGLDWATRLMIIKGVARGLAYLYREFPGLTVPHGHLKSSNVLLDNNFNPLLAEYALIPLINRDHAQKFMVAFKSPEFYHTERTLKKTDVWSLGILILEMLTGKFPANYLQPGKRANADLAAWVNSVVREEWTGEVFDKDMKGTKNGEGEMLKLLKIGMCCCESNVEGRWDWREVVDKIEQLKERDTDEDYSSYASDGDAYSSRVISEDDLSFSVTA